MGLKSAQEIERGVNEVLVEPELKESLIRLNPEIALRNELVDEDIYKLRAVLITVNQVGLVKANEEFFKWLTGEKDHCGYSFAHLNLKTQNSHFQNDSILL